MQEFEIDEAEAFRVARQAELDDERSGKERNALGQFATPTSLARDVMRFALSVHPGGAVDFFEPSCGSGAFYSALLAELPADRLVVRSAVGVELDERFVNLADSLWADHGFDVSCGDFFDPRPTTPESVSLLVANPPYVRHHHISKDLKPVLGKRCEREVGIKPSGLAGLYVYFVLLSHATLAPGAVSAWLIPAEFLDTNYGSALRAYLAGKVTTHRIHRFDPEGTQFDDALVTSCVVVFTNTRSNDESHHVQFSEGGTVNTPHTVRAVPQSGLKPSEKWSKLFNHTSVNTPIRHVPQLGEFLTVKRGIATGRNDFFILTREHVESFGIHRVNVVPILPSPRHLKTDTVSRGTDGYPDIPTQLAVLNPSGSLDDIMRNDPALAEYLQAADERTLGSYLVSKRSPWYRMEQRDPSPFLLSYMGRGNTTDDRPFRFILNYSDAVATNMYLMLYPRGSLRTQMDSGEISVTAVFDALQTITATALLQGGRVYGGGLRKIEPKELKSLDATVLADLVTGYTPTPTNTTLF